jgi:hypothetical protein
MLGATAEPVAAVHAMQPRKKIDNCHGIRGGYAKAPADRMM